MEDNQCQNCGYEWRDSPRYIRQPDHDRRIGRGDDFAGDAYLDTETNTIQWVAVGHNPND